MQKRQGCGMNLQVTDLLVGRARTRYVITIQVSRMLFSAVLVVLQKLKKEIAGTNSS